MHFYFTWRIATQTCLVLRTEFYHLVDVVGRLRVGCVVGLVVLLTPEAVTLAENWPSWRGPRGNGISTEVGLPVSWDTERNVTWKLEMPEWSGSTPIVWGEHVFLSIANGDTLELWSVDRNTGQPL